MHMRLHRRAGETGDEVMSLDPEILMELPDRFSIHPGNQTKAMREFLRDAEREGWLHNPSFDNFFLTDEGKQLRDLLKLEAGQ